MMKVLFFSRKSVFSKTISLAKIVPVNIISLYFAGVSVHFNSMKAG